MNWQPQTHPILSSIFAFSEYWNMMEGELRNQQLLELGRDTALDELISWEHTVADSA